MTRRAFLPSLVSLSILAALGAPPAVQADAPEKGYARLLITVKPGVHRGQLFTEMHKHGASEEAVIERLRMRLARVPEHRAQRILERLKRHHLIEHIEIDRSAQLAATIPDDPRYGDEWHLQKIGAASAWDASLGNGVVVAVLDTGVNDAHEDLVGKVLPGWNSADGSGDYSDIQGHGTLVAGVIAAASNNSRGVASLAWNAQILPVRVTNRSDGMAYVSDIARAITWAADQGADIANISYDVAGSPAVMDAAAYMRSKGGLVVVAAGNTGSDPGFSPSPDLLVVSATNSGDSLTSWSSYGNYVDLSAPGASILTTARGGGYKAVSGTSFASPMAAGLAALLRAINPAYTPAELEALLMNSAVDLGAAGTDPLYGAGRIDASGAVQLALAQAPGDSEPPVIQDMQPVSGAVVSGSAVTVLVDASDNEDVASVELLVNGSSYATDYQAPYEFSWDSTRVADGAVTLEARVSDAAGNVATVQRQVTVANAGADTVAPTVSLRSPVEGAELSGRVRLRARGFDDVAVVRMEAWIDGKLHCSKARTRLACAWKTQFTSPGLHDVTVVAYDAAGNRGETSVQVNVVATTASN
ncbi:S8 family serine peptidase [Thiohalobacter sp.]|uniref:S8 family serine peptidase n=1 Tax=Thiohalobacter sp. TaxID=2025948 RepID=UPI0026259C39|nr:S8 family serine peptidase [Thiohalobacter sp.]